MEDKLKCVADFDSERAENSEEFDEMMRTRANRVMEVYLKRDEKETSRILDSLANLPS